MKNTIAIAMLTAILVSLIGCNPFERAGHSLMKITRPGNEQRMIINDDDMSLDITYSGDIEFNEAETAIEKISQGGYLDYRKNGKRLLAEAGTGGNVIYTFYNDEYGPVKTGNGKEFLAGAIREMIAYGLFIKGRMERLYQEGGTPLLMKEAKKAKADNVKRMYLEFILESDSLSDNETAAVFNSVATMMQSDDDKRKILEKVAPVYLPDSLNAEPYFAAVESMHSDHDKANTLKKILREPVSEHACRYFLKAAGSIKSDHDKANVLGDLIKTVGFSPEIFNNLVEAIRGIHSDHDKANVLKKLIDQQVYHGEPFSRLLDVIATISSDNEKADLFNKLARQDIGTNEGWISLINKITSISSDHDKANVLIGISRNMPRNEAVLAAYMKTSRTLNTDHDLQRAVKAVKEVHDAS